MNRIVKSSCLLLSLSLAPGAFASLQDAPDATHAWGNAGDFYQPRPFAVKTAPGAYPSDAIVLTDAAKVSAAVAADAQLHFAAKGNAKLAFFGADALADVAAQPGADGWIVYDVLFHRPAEGHDGLLTVFANGVCAKDVTVAKADGSTPLALSGDDLFGAWIRKTPAPWAIKTHGRYADKDVVRKIRAATAARAYDAYLNLEYQPRHGMDYFRYRKLVAAALCCIYCADEPYKSAFEKESVAMTELVTAKDSKIGSGRMLDMARAIYPLQTQGVITKDHPLVKAMLDKGVKAW